MSRDPQRWLDVGAEAPLEIVELLRHAEPPEQLDAASLEKLIARTEAALASAGPPVAATSLWLKWLVVLGAASLIVGAAVWALSSVGRGTTSRAVSREREAGVAAAAARGASPSREGRDLAVEQRPNAVQPRDEGEASMEAARSQPRRRPTPAYSSVRDDSIEDSLAAEAESLERIRGTLERGEPERALADVRAHRRRFSRPQLADEAERLEIDALVRSGRFPEARRRASSFLRRRPRSVYAPRVRALLEEIGP